MKIPVSMKKITLRAIMHHVVHFDSNWLAARSTQAPEQFYSPTFGWKTLNYEICRMENAIICSRLHDSTKRYFPKDSKDPVLTNLCCSGEQHVTTRWPTEQAEADRGLRGSVCGRLRDRDHQEVDQRRWQLGQDKDWRGREVAH